MKRSLLFLLFTLFMLSNYAQNSISDCNGAIVLCDDFYSEAQAPLSTGNIYEFTGACNQNLEQSSVWYTFTVQQPGNLGFVITPNDLSDDYDWGLFNITNGGCAGINNSTSPTVSCNSWGISSGNNGPTGISTALGGVSNVGGPGNFNGPPFNANLAVQPGQSYALVVMNWSNSPFGYSIDFSESTASLFDAIPPQPISLTADCSNSVISLQMSEGIITTSIQSTDFLLVGSDGIHTFSSASGQNPNSSLNSTINLTLTEPLTQPGTYNLIFTGISNFVVDGCDNPSEGSIEIEIVAPLSFQVETTAACNGQGGAIEFSNIIGGTAPYTVSVNGFEIEGLSIENVPAATYPITISDVNNCFINTQVEVPDQVILLSIGDQDSLSCTQDFITIQNVVISPDQQVNYQWAVISESGSIGGPTNIENPIITSVGLYELLVTNPTTGCSSSAYTEIAHTQSYEFNEGELLFDVQTFSACNGQDGAMEFSNIIGGLQPYIISVDGSDFSQLFIDDLNAETYPITITDANSCYINSEVLIPDQILTLSIGLQDSLSCTQSSVVIDNVTIIPNQTVNYQWTVISQTGEIIGSQTIENPVVTEQGIFQLTVIDPITGCSNFATTEVISKQDLGFNQGDFDFDISTVTACNGQNGVLTISDISGGFEPYIISVNGFVLSNSFIGGLTPGNYPVVITDDNNCFVSTVVNIPNHNIAVSIGIQDTLSCVQKSVVIRDVVVSPQQNVNYQWTIISETGIIAGLTNVENAEILEQGIFNLVVTDPISGCFASDFAEVVSEEIYVFDENDLIFPNIITPNNDDKNDFWIPQLSSDPDFDITQIMDEFDLKIFNRWGNLIYESDANKKLWNPGDTEEGVFFYTLHFRISCGNLVEKNLQGNIQLLRK